MDAENYQLKWHSYSSYMHSCVAGALFNETFADCALYTADGFCIMAHKFILSSCSQYFHQMLKVASTRSATTLPLIIVLPTEINHKTLKILIQYMYSGESTVSKDVLQQVLRGGDLLKIKGLYRPREEVSNENVKVKNCKSNAEESVEKKTSNNQKVLNYTLSLNAEKSKEPVNSSPTSSSSHSEKEKKEENVAFNSGNIGSSSVIKSTGNNNKEIKKNNKRGDGSANENRSGNENSSDNLQFLVIKEEPLEWSEMSDADMKDVFSTEITIKPEIFNEGEEDVNESSSSSGNENLYTPLTCELCSETFTVPAEWVRHVQTHTDMLPAKRQRRGRPAPDEENAPFPPLTCDMCQKSFLTPAEWVHHIQDTHTEFELHWTNKQHLSKKHSAAPSNSSSTTDKVGSNSVKGAGGGGKQLGPIQKVCSVCTKKFPSHASMLIHKRTHTGEKPYACEYCMKGFNVKSNLLRHLRTLHDKIIHPTEIDGTPSPKNPASANGNSDGDD